MEAVKAWARSIFLLAVVSSTALLLVPKSMQKQSRFVAEMLILLCVIAPLATLVSATARETLVPGGLAAVVGEQPSLGKFYADETARRVTEIAQRTGLPVVEVSVATKDSGFSLASVVVRLAEHPEGDRLTAFTGSLAAYLGIGNDKLWVVVDK